MGFTQTVTAHVHDIVLKEMEMLPQSVNKKLCKPKSVVVQSHYSTRGCVQEIMASLYMK